MTGAQRCRIEFGLSAGESARSIAKALGVSLSTVTREISKHIYESFKSCHGRANQCVHRQDCKLTGVRGDLKRASSRDPPRADARRAGGTVRAASEE